jgi:hypothetical protein
VLVLPLQIPRPGDEVGSTVEKVLRCSQASKPLRRQIREDSEFKTSLSCTVRLCLKQTSINLGTGGSYL